MSKTEKPNRPREGGSYVRDGKTGKLSRKHFTKPAPRRTTKAKTASPAPERVETPVADKKEA
ncbi:MAG: hypothetical protein KUG65_13170 [Sphingomonadaceae bacterium]|nr:hypothetical protein [Sphingomonadaceae bacterium]